MGILIDGKVPAQVKSRRNVTATRLELGM